MDSIYIFCGNYWSNFLIREYSFIRFILVKFLLLDFFNWLYDSYF